ncbi:MAG: aromatic amino acid lyase [Cohnella sp.]|uniref:HAL/PAL/TAL family ammonia-lyase n=1 Tax=Cohnella sp. TaxID=1883426 RepID=UPI000E3719D2|nr:aromatic amino acid ammonia-lyase [Cohnella sp.]REK64071.1 MAG: aromatic amino acid lyase [Cohnella sp.]
MSGTVRLDGRSLTIEALEQIALRRYKVELAPEAVARVEKAHLVLHELAAKGIPIYGFNRGVGINKDREISSDFFENYNRNLIYSHSAGIEPAATEEQARAVLAARLNTLLLGATGVHPQVVNMYRDFLNAGIHPVLPLRGSVGAADITVLSHIGLAMIGEGDVIYKGATVPASDALRRAGLAPLKLGPKDGLAIVSSNALSAGLGALVLGEAARLLETADIVFALSLEAIRGCISPLDEAAYRLRPYEGAAESAAFVRSLLAGGDLPELDTSSKIQDPLSFRSACHVHGAARDSLAYARKLLLVQLNSSDDNPCLLADEQRIVPSSNFDVTAWTLAFEMLGIALSHVSKISCYRAIKLGTPQFTGLPRFLSPDPASAIAYGTIQKTFTSLDAEIRHLSNPVSADYFSLSGDMEDHANNTPLVVRKTAEIIDRLYYILSMEAMHAAQAIDLREAVRLGQGTREAYAAIRSVVPVLSQDRFLTPDIQAVYKLLASSELLKRTKGGMAANE